MCDNEQRTTAVADREISSQHETVAADEQYDQNFLQYRTIKRGDEKDESEIGRSINQTNHIEERKKKKVSILQTTELCPKKKKKMIKDHKVYNLDVTAVGRSNYMTILSYAGHIVRNSAIESDRFELYEPCIMAILKSKYCR